MWLPFYLLLWVVGIAAAVFVIKLVVSLRVAHNAPAWETLSDQRSGAAKADLGRGEMHAERVLVDADSVLDGGIGRSSLERLGEQDHAAGEVARAQGA
ncbi:MAG: hypothetical protein JWN63_3544 [Candidatus Acidoferrum typicum]|jgi:hypothetical protein|nr:hypothetical protein [Candidatus Acidoferrum typicum]